MVVMRTAADIQEAFTALSQAAKFADRTGDRDSYEVLANCAMALGWVLGNEGNFEEAFQELLKWARWGRIQEEWMRKHPAT